MVDRPGSVNEALLRLSTDARGAHGVMDASPVQAAIEKRS